MKGTELLILFNEDKACLCDGFPLSFDQLGFPPVAKYFKAPAHWKVRVLNYREAENRIFVSVLSYKTGLADYMPQQLQLKEKLSLIKQITFKSIDTEGMLATMRGQAGMQGFEVFGLACHPRINVVAHPASPRQTPMRN